MSQAELPKCASCSERLPTKRLPNGEIVKKWADDICGDCWAAKDIIKNRNKYRNFRPQMVELLEHLNESHLEVILGVCPTPFGDLVSDLYQVEGDVDWIELISDFIEFLSSVKADSLKVARQLHLFFVGV